MTREEAKALLEMSRPSGREPCDPRVAEALDWAQRDPELGRWLADQQAFDALMRASLKEISVPSGLKASILAASGERVLEPTAETPQVGEAWVGWNRGIARLWTILQTPIIPGRTIIESVLWRSVPVRLSAVAAFLLTGTVAGLWITSQPPTFARFQEEIVEMAWQSERHVDLATNRMEAVCQWLSTQQYGTNFTLPTALSKSHLHGAKSLDWQGRRVAMLCYLEGPRHHHLFVVKRHDFQDDPSPFPLDYANQGRRWPRMWWSQGDLTYLFAGQKLRPFLNRFYRNGQWLFEPKPQSLPVELRPGIAFASDPPSTITACLKPKAWLPLMALGQPLED